MIFIKKQLAPISAKKINSKTSVEVSRKIII